MSNMTAPPRICASASSRCCKHMPTRPRELLTDQGHPVTLTMTTVGGDRFFIDAVPETTLADLKALVKTRFAAAGGITLLYGNAQSISDDVEVQDLSCTEMQVCLTPQHLIATGTKGFVVHVFDVFAGVEVARFDHPMGPLYGGIYSVAISPDCRKVFTASSDNIVRVIDIDSRRRECEFVLGSDVNCLACHPGGCFLAVGCENAIVRVFNVVTRLEEARFDLAAFLTGNGDVDDSMIQTVEDFVAHSFSATLCLAWNPTGTKLAAGSDAGHAAVIDFTSRTWCKNYSQGGAVRSIDWHPQGAAFATGSEDKYARIVDFETGDTLWEYHHDFEVESVAWSFDGMHLATAACDGYARIFSFRPDCGHLIAPAWVIGHVSVKMFAHSYAVRSVGWSYGGDKLFTTCDDYFLHVYDVQTGEEDRRSSDLRHESYVMAVSR